MCGSGKASPKGTGGHQEPTPGRLTQGCDVVCAPALSQRQGDYKHRLGSIEMQPATNDVIEVNLSALLMLLYKLLRL